MIEVRNLYHDYEGKGNYSVEDVSFSIREGEIFGFLGPSGAGKSTVQNIMTGLLSLQKGEIKYNNTSVKDIKSNFFNKIGVSFEHPNLYSKLTGYENLKYYAGLFDVPTENPYKLLDMVGLKDATNKKTSDYSKGMKQRLVFARAMINKPKIMFLDEPLSGLDPTTASKIKELIKHKKREGTTIFLTTHNMFVADELCDKVAFLNDGKIVAIDSPRSLKLENGQNSVKVEYKDNNEVKYEYFYLDIKEDITKFNELLNKKKVQTIHSQEATLEQIFIKLTGRGLA